MRFVDRIHTVASHFDEIASYQFLLANPFGTGCISPTVTKEIDISLLILSVKKFQKKVLNACKKRFLYAKFEISTGK